MTERSTMRDVCVDFRERGRSYVADLTFIYHLQRMFETLRLWVPSLDISQFSFLQVVGSFIESDIRAHFCLQVQRKIFTMSLIIFQYNISKNISIRQCIDGNTLLKYFVKTFCCQDEASGSKQFASESRCNCCNCCIFKIFAFPQLNGTKRFQTTATLQATCMFSFSLWTLVPGTRQWLPQIFFHRTVSDETDQAEAAVKMQKPREIVERTTVSVWRLEIFAVASCQEMSRIATAFALGWTLEYSERNTKTPAGLYQDHFKLTLDCPAQLSRISSTSFCTFKVVSSRTWGNNSCHQNLMIIIALANLVSRLKVGRRCLSGVTLWPSAVTTWKLCWKNMDETSVWCSAVILEVFRREEEDGGNAVWQPGGKLLLVNTRLLWCLLSEPLSCHAKKAQSLNSQRSPHPWSSLNRPRRPGFMFCDFYDATTYLTWDIEVDGLSMAPYFPVYSFL